MRKLGSLVALAALLVGTPLALFRLGYYSWERLNVWAPADFRILLGLLTLAGWAAWLLFAVSTVLEALRILSRGRITIRLPGLSLPQALAGTLLTAILVSAASPAVVSAAPPTAAPAPVVATAGAPAASGSAAEEAPAAALHHASAATSDARTVVHLVASGDDLWSLAEHYYGSGGQWRAIVDANPDLLAADPTADLPAGTALAIVNPTAVALATDTPGPSTERHTVEKGDTLWHLAEERLGDGQRYPELQRLNADQITDPDYIETGWVIDLPTVPAAASAPPSTTTPAPPTAAPTPSPTATPAPTRTASAAPAPVASKATAEPGIFDSVAVRATLGGLAALAASGVLGSVLARRRERAASRELGRTFGAPEAELRRFETALGLAGNAAAADAGGAVADGPDGSVAPENVGRVHLVDRAMRLLAEAWWRDGVRPPRLRRAVLGDDLEFHFDDLPPDVPAPFELDAAARSVLVGWANLRLAETPAHGVAYPGLVTLGEDAAGRLVMVDVVTWGVLAVDGDRPDLPDASLTAMLVELSCSPWADELALTVVTRDADFVDAAAIEHVRRLPDAAAGVDDLERHFRERHALLTLAERSYDSLRLDPDRADAWAPIVYLFEDAPDAAQLTRIRRSVDGERLGLAAVLPLTDATAAAEAEPATERPRLHLTRDADAATPLAVLEPAGITVSAQTIEPDVRDSIVRLFDEARSTATAPAYWWRDNALIPAHAPETETATEPPADPDVTPTTGHDQDPPTAMTSASPIGDVAMQDVNPPELDAGASVPGPDASDVDATHPRASAPDSDVDSAPDSNVGGPDPDAAHRVAGPTDQHASDAEPDPAHPDADIGATLSPLHARTLRAVGAPRLRLFGAVRLEGATGEPPTKAQRRCLEYCGWLLAHPGATASEMTTALFVSDGTRRSNLSRLRTWLGVSTEGEPYLPEAYTGRITLHPEVTSDWADLQRLVAAGVNHTSPARLRAALALVDGAPIADAAPGEWSWADALRTEMAELVRDAAVLLARAERVRGDLDAARWACARGRLVASDDELIGRELMLIGDAAGRPEDVSAELRRLGRAAANRGADLDPLTVDLGQRLLEGARRPALAAGGAG